MTVLLRETPKARKNLVPRPTRILLVVILCLGLFFRFAQLEQKVYWVDEVSTALRVSGFTLHEFQTTIVDGPEFEIAQLKRYQYPNPDKGVAETIQSLAVEDPQHPPLFFLLLRSWINLFGQSVTSLRSLAAVFSLLMLPATWFLCRELFQSQSVGWVAIALLAVSPMQIIYAQESRHYSLWMLLILLSSNALLRALRLGNWQSWAVYAVSVAAGLYTHLFFALIALGHGFYTAWVGRGSRNGLAYLISSGLAGLSFMPWLLLLLNRDKGLTGVGWMDEAPGLLGMLIRIFGVLSRTFVDFGVSPTDASPIKLVIVPLMLIVLGISGVALFVLIRRTPVQIWLFVVTLAGVTGAVILFSYFVLNKQIATTRYMLPISLSLHLAVAYYLTQALRRNWTNWLGVTLLSAGILSCMIRLNTAVWWNQLPEFSRDVPAIAQVLNQSENALVIVDASTGEFNLLLLQGLVHSINQKVQFKVVRNADRAPLIQSSQRQVFVYFPFVPSPDALNQTLKERYDVRKLKPLFKSFWQVVA